MKATKDQLKAIGSIATKVVTQGEYDGMCDPISIKFCEILHNQGIQTQGIASTDFLGEHPHYVALISGENVSFTDAHQLIVDPTILQFEEELSHVSEEIPETLIVTTKDEEWNEWYQNLEPIDDKRLEYPTD